MSSSKGSSSAPNVATLPGAAVVGAGLAGCLLAVYLRRRGVEVDIFESRADMRQASAERGRSINLVLTSRGMDALDRVGLLERVLGVCTPVFGRTLHSQTGTTAYQSYGPDPTFANYSISRTDLNIVLLDAAEAAGARLHFNHALDHLDVRARTLYCYVRHEGHPHVRAYKASHVFGADGAGSRVRQAMKHALGPRCDDRGTPLGASYKELLMPAAPGGGYAIDKDSLHIWPRGSHFLMALPNLDGSFTLTLYLPDKGDVSFEALSSPEKIEAYFREYYPDALPLLPDIQEQWGRNPQGFLGTVTCTPWFAGDAAVLVGDAAHAITPFFGQGCNASFEGVVTLDAALTAANGGRVRGMSNVGEAFSAYFKRYKANGDAIAQMAVENYYEMMDKTGDPHFLAQKELETLLARKFPDIYLARYALVTHTLVPYAACKAIGEAQQKVLDQLLPPPGKVPTTTVSGKGAAAAAAAAAAASAAAAEGKKVELNEQLAHSLLKSTLVPVLRQHRVGPKQFADVSRALVLKATKGAAAPSAPASATLHAKL